MSTEAVVLVTGSARRLGAATVREFHRRGWRVLIHCHHSLAEAEALAAELNGVRENSAQVLVADLGDLSALSALATHSVQRWGRLDALVNNASTFYPTTLAEATPAHWQDLFGSNAQAPFFLTQALLPALKAAQGSVINMLDIHASRPLAQHSIYCMAKAALLMMTKALARELATEIRVNAIAPGAILWPEGADAAAQVKILANIPLQRLGTPEDIARTIAFLVMDAPYITGQIISVDGGRGI
jgi:pteridine reductase